jgi:hypothetical protein
MNRGLLAAVLVATMMLVSACGRGDTTAAPSAPTDAPLPAEQLAADAAAAAQACSQDCGNGVITSIQCAAGETAVCDCAQEPKAKCEPPTTPAP